MGRNTDLDLTLVAEIESRVSFCRGGKCRFFILNTYRLTNGLTERFITYLNTERFKEDIFTDLNQKDISLPHHVMQHAEL